MEKWHPKYEKIWIALTLLLVLPALFLNLNLAVLIEDEGIRGLVALEMDLSGNYLVPTLNGELYFKKPPLFNWIILLFFQLLGKADEWGVRLPTILALLGFAHSVYYFGKKQLGFHLAFLAALALITCGRFLFYDSMFGLIDTSFSWVVFVQMMLVFVFFERKKWLLLFLSTYLLTSIAFLLKGLPALAFQALTLLAYFSYKKSFWKLLSWQHLVGILLLFALLGTYYFAYQEAGGDLEQLFQVTLNENTQRTAVNNEVGIGATIAHLFSFPFEMLIYHFLPWSLLVLAFIQKGFFKQIKAQPFLAFIGITFLANIWVYWVSPAIFPRYLFMFLPLQFYLMLYFWVKLPENAWQKKVFYYLIGLIIIVAAVSSPAFFFIDQLAGVQYKTPTTIFAMLIYSLCAWAFIKYKSNRLLVLGVFLLAFRLIFNVFVLPIRVQDDKSALCRSDAQALGQHFKNKNLKIIGKEDTYHTYSFYTNSFYFSAETDYILKRVDLKDVQEKQPYLLEFYLEAEHINQFDHVVDSMRMRHRLHPLKIVE